MDISALLDFAITHKASDLHLSAGLAPKYRIDGELQVFDHPILEQTEIAAPLQKSWI